MTMWRVSHGVRPTDTHVRTVDASTGLTDERRAAANWPPLGRRASVHVMRGGARGGATWIQPSYGIERILGGMQRLSVSCASIGLLSARSSKPPPSATRPPLQHITACSTITHVLRYRVHNRGSKTVILFQSPRRKVVLHITVTFRQHESRCDSGATNGATPPDQASAGNAS